MTATLFRVISPLVLVVVIGAGCKSSVTTAPPAPAEVVISQPLSRPITDAVEYTGTTAAPASVDVVARVTGFLQKVNFEPRAHVKEGTAIFEIDARPFKAASDRANAEVKAKEAQLVKADFDAKRITDLFNKGVAAPDEYTKETANRDVVSAAVAASKATAERTTLELSWCQVTSPISGRISRNLIDTGNIVTADQTVLARITNDDSLYVYFNCSERDVLTIRDRARQDFIAAGGKPEAMPDLGKSKCPIYLGTMVEEGFPHEGVIDYTSPEVDSSTGTMQVRGVFPNPGGVLLPGLFVRLKIPIGKPYTSLVVSERALGSDQGQRYLLAVNASNVVEYRPVKVGSLEKGLRVITQGIAQADWIIVNGIQRVRPGVKVAAQRVSMESQVTPGAPSRAPATQSTASGSQSESGHSSVAAAQ